MPISPRLFRFRPSLLHALPQSLCRAFSHARAYPIIENEYRNGESQTSVLAATSRKNWSLRKRVAPTQLQALRNFYDARNGTHEPFHIYDPYDASPRFSYDPTGVATTGRYVRHRLDGSPLGLAGPTWIAN